MQNHSFITVSMNPLGGLKYIWKLFPYRKDFFFALLVLPFAKSINYVKICNIIIEICKYLPFAGWIRPEGLQTDFFIQVSKPKMLRFSNYFGLHTTCYSHFNPTNFLINHNTFLLSCFVLFSVFICKIFYLNQINNIYSLIQITNTTSNGHTIRLVLHYQIQVCF